ncbi:hypothetical protein Pmar_PMAR019100 [Perkinsus marinus ATCC 50983]|uniref:Uncharacterized protein n=1 Tax=Perkinsus marinus (strain ATCC 50983 / TXsc) TaxID=423536 RepID=C5KTV4_PERM5|nr:hypothetical protein Pmar_PMAR019100 [Perkinsus marinus ATCC 50983]EER11996.1 hypothetical protein Pmar_PMAR019100 [Perkinsus marinus ATCC 50983]|eukprot:XP_002780201.1 hypothetical protein Pmar_PMAR019100 [Perkinsus marinus ATCC 50983]
MFQQLLPFVLLSVSQASYDEPRLVYEYETLKVSSFAGKTHCGIIEEEFKLHEPHMVLGVKEFRFAIDPPTGVTLTTYMDTKRNQRAHL